MTIDQKHAVRAVAMVLLTAVSESGHLGAPSGVLYAAVMGGLSLSQYQQIMGGMERAKWITLSGQCYHITAPGRGILAKNGDK